MQKRKNKSLKWLWNFSWYRLKVFKVNKWQLNKIFSKNNWYLIHLSSIDFEKLKNNIKKSDQYLPAWNDNKIITINKKEFKNWFELNKDYNKKYLILNNINHCKHEYRWIRFNGYRGYILKN